MRLDKFLAEMQTGTRSQVKEYVKKGLVTVNNEIVKKSDIKIDENKDVICFQGRQLTYSKYYYYMLNKPSGVVTATMDNHDKTVMDLLSDADGKDLFPVGRLDKDTEGLLLITNDGELGHNLLSPKKHVDKTYYVECDGSIDDDKINRLEQGLDIGDDEITHPAKVELLSKENDRYVIKITITEGRFHQVKRMIQAVDGKVIYLKRLTMGSLILDEKLDYGEYRPLTQEEIDSLRR